MATNTKIYHVALAIQQAEGWRSAGVDGPTDLGSASYRNHNPGNLRSSPFELANENNFSVFENDEVGMIALVWQLWVYAHNDMGTMINGTTIKGAISRYNGLSISDPAFENYISIIEKVGGVNRNDPVSSLLINN